MENSGIMRKIHKGLIVSCQALEDEPLHSSFIMSRMALAAKQGGAVAIRANSPEDIRAIRETVDLPVIGLHKVNYPDSPIYITPTMQEVDGLVQAGADIIAMDATARLRPQGVELADFFAAVRRKYPDRLFMADTSCYEEGERAEKLGFDLVGTTLAGYTEYTRGRELPDFTLMRRYVGSLKTPVIAEGGIWTPEQLKEAVGIGVWAAVIGTAITRPAIITRRFASVLEQDRQA